MPTFPFPIFIKIKTRLHCLYSRCLFHISSKIEGMASIAIDTCRTRVHASDVTQCNTVYHTSLNEIKLQILQYVFTVQYFIKQFVGPLRLNNWMSLWCWWLACFNGIIGLGEESQDFPSSGSVQNRQLYSDYNCVFCTSRTLTRFSLILTGFSQLKRP